MVKRIEKTAEQWRELLTAEQFAVAREAATERAFTGRYYHHFEKGRYLCACCGTPLFDSGKKYDSGSGWPSFTAPIADDNVATREDRTHGMHRVEVSCAACDAHLGHLFPDGPPTAGGRRYCINSAALNFQAKDEHEN